MLFEGVINVDKVFLFGDIKGSSEFILGVCLD